MNKDEINAIGKFLSEMDKKIIDNNKKWNLQQKEILKDFVNSCYEEFKKENNIN